MDTKIILNFLTDLNVNNAFDWMKANKKYYEQAKIEYEILIQELMNGILTFDNSIEILPPKELMFKLNRDTRFSNNKLPYNPTFRVHISNGGKLPIPVGYYLSVKPGNIFLGGGLFAAMFADATKSIRDYIIKNTNKFVEILEAEEFKNNFVVDGEKLKNVPKEYDKEHKLAEYIKNKSWYIEYKVNDTIFLKPEEFIKTSVKLFKYMKPFNDYLNKALKDFRMPERK
jgi:uncharacterized protein (TIGR02453 family)